MAEPEADRRDVDEVEEAFGGFVLAGGDTTGVLEFVEAALDEVSQPVEGASTATRSLWDLRIGITGTTLRASMVFEHCQSYSLDPPAGHRAPACVIHEQVETQIVRCLPRCDVRPHGQASTVDAEVDLGREATP